MNIKRNDLVKQMGEKFGYSKKDATQLIDDFCDIVVDNLRNGNSVSIHNFGCFDVLERKEHALIDLNGERKVVPAHWVPRFYPGKQMRLVVKMWEDDTKRGLI